MENSIGVLAIIIDEVETAEKKSVQKILVEKNSNDTVDKWGFPCYFLSEDTDDKDFLIEKIKDYHDVDIVVSKPFGTFKLQDEANTVIRNYVCMLGDEGIFSYEENIKWVTKEELHELQWVSDQLDLANKVYDSWSMIFFNKEKIAGAAKDVAQGVMEKAGVLAGVLKTGGLKAKKAMGEAKRDLDIKIHKPISPEQFKSSEYKIPEIIYVIDEDKKMSMEIFEGAIGHEDAYKSESGQFNVLTLYRPRIDDLKTRFYPNLQNTLYYKHPFEAGMFISLEEYFKFIRKGKADELNMIAQSLGAKYVKIALKEEKVTFIKKEESGEKEFTNFELISECSYDGNANPMTPKLNYFRDDAEINSLINARMQGSDAVTSKTYTIKYNASSGLKESEAVKIDTILKKFKLKGNGTVLSEVEKENRLYLEYQIEF